MNPADAPSFWLGQAGRQPPRAHLEGPLEADVCIVGAGFTGLWTAYELRRSDPTLSVVVLEAESVGFGASGRNGGWVTAELAGSTAAWERTHGIEGVRGLMAAIRRTVDEVGEVAAREGIDCDFVKGGMLAVAHTAKQAGRIREAISEDHRRGGDDCEAVWLDSTELSERVVVRGAVGARFSPHCARTDPGKLVLGLAQAAERAGVAIYERNRVLGVGPGVAHTAQGDVRARVIVRATEAYTPTLRGQRRVVAPISSALIVTEPLADHVWRALRWDSAETMIDGRRIYAYLQRTADGRIAIGGRGKPYSYGSGTQREGAVHPATIARLRTRLGELFGDEVGGARIDKAWQGVLGVTRQWRPAVGFDATTGLAWASGYVGEGVAAANLAGRTLRDLILGHETELTRLPWVSDEGPRWEPEPFRYLGIRGVYALYRLADDLEARTGRTAAAARLADRLSGH